MLETALVAFTTFFATIGPAAWLRCFRRSRRATRPAERRGMAIKGTLIATAVLLVFALFGETLLRLFGISLPALRTADGILLLLIAIDLVFARPSGGTSTTREENEEAVTRHDISVFPLATPLIAGPGAIGAAILLVADAQGDELRIAVIVLALLAVLALTFLLLLAASQVQRLLGVTACTSSRELPASCWRRSRSSSSSMVSAPAASSRRPPKVLDTHRPFRRAHPGRSDRYQRPTSMSASTAATEAPAANIPACGNGVASARKAKLRTRSAAAGAEIVR